MGTAGKMFRDLVEIFDFDFGVPIFFRVKNDIGPFLASAKAHIGLDLDISQSFCGDTLLKFGHELLRAAGFAIDILADKTDSAHRFLLAS
jgi:hypothetical protein